MRRLYLAIFIITTAVILPCSQASAGTITKEVNGQWRQAGQHVHVGLGVCLQNWFCTPPSGYHNAACTYHCTSTSIQLGVCLGFDSCETCTASVQKPSSSCRCLQVCPDDYGLGGGGGGSGDDDDGSSPGNGFCTEHLDCPVGHSCIQHSCQEGY